MIIWKLMVPAAVVSLPISIGLLLMKESVLISSLIIVLSIAGLIATHLYFTKERGKRLSEIKAVEASINFTKKEREEKLMKREGIEASIRECPDSNELEDIFYSKMSSDDCEWKGDLIKLATVKCVREGWIDFAKRLANLAGRKLTMNELETICDVYRKEGYLDGFRKVKKMIDSGCFH